MSNDIQDKYDIHFPVGSSLCPKHRIGELKANETQMETDDNDGEYTAPPSEMVDECTKDDLDSYISNITELKSASPMKFQVKSPVQELAPSTMRYILNSRKRCVLRWLLGRGTH